MTPLLAALSRSREAVLSRARAVSRSPASAASRNLRIDVFSDDFTLLLRSRAFSLVAIRLIWDLMFATWVSLDASSEGESYVRGVPSDPALQPAARARLVRLPAAGPPGQTGRTGPPRSGGEADRLW